MIFPSSIYGIDIFVEDSSLKREDGYYRIDEIDETVDVLKVRGVVLTRELYDYMCREFGPSEERFELKVRF